jgi:Phosphate transporter family
VKRAIERAMGEQDWHDAGARWQGKDGRLRLQGWSRHRRIVILRRRLERSLALSERDDAAGAATLFLATAFGIPVSTTLTIAGAIVGLGAARKVAAVRWNVASNVVVAWILTMPATALRAPLKWMTAAVGNGVHHENVCRHY